MPPKVLLLVVALLALSGGTSVAADREPPPKTPDSSRPVPPKFAPMTLERLDRLIRSIDSEARRQDSQWQFKVGDVALVAIADGKADRMRVMLPAAKADALTREVLYRALQADFDAALDARYAIANGVVWTVFLHPLGSLHEEDFLSGMAQVIVAAQTFGTTYTSGSLVFGGGDSNEAHRRLLEDLRQRARLPGST